MYKPYQISFYKLVFTEYFWLSVKQWREKSIQQAKLGHCPWRIEVEVITQSCTSEFPVLDRILCLMYSSFKLAHLTAKLMLQEASLAYCESRADLLYSMPCHSVYYLAVTPCQTQTDHKNDTQIINSHTFIF